MGIEIGNIENPNIPSFVHQLLDKCPKIWRVETVEYFIKLKILEITNPPELWNMPIEKKKDEALRRKKRGNDLFISGKIEKALKNYKRGIDALNDILKNNNDKVKDNDDKEKINNKARNDDINLFVTLQSNASMVCLKLKDNKGAIEHANKGLEYDEKHLKCLTRKAQALLMLGNFEKSKELINTCLKIDSENKYCMKL